MVFFFYIEPSRMARDDLYDEPGYIFFFIFKDLSILCPFYGHHHRRLRRHHNHPSVLILSNNVLPISPAHVVVATSFSRTNSRAYHQPSIVSA